MLKVSQKNNDDLSSSESSIEMESTNGKENINVNQRRCRICGLIGHNARTCENAEYADWKATTHEHV
ncbi:31356_t:CDS:2 [Racocetra persica]|uniref:31356_t:CDS:1 n=1 Tax=Racocetra persica TaxID=160502 RepID=A0ACA9MKM9_9GLOM|nr:31356_t:CDS:2 [Racocetra persica]